MFFESCCFVVGFECARAGGIQKLEQGGCWSAEQWFFRPPVCHTARPLSGSCLVRSHIFCFTFKFMSRNVFDVTRFGVIY